MASSMNINQRGFVVYGAIAALMVIGGLSVYAKVQSSRLEAVKAEYAGFQAQVKAAGEVAQAKAKAKEAADKQLKEKIDNENKTLRANLAAASKRMSDARTSVRFLPAPTTGTVSPTVTADRAGLEDALRNFDSAVARLVDQGDQAIADLNSAKQWAKALNRPAP